MTDISLNSVLGVVQEPVSRCLAFLRAGLPSWLAGFGRRDAEAIIDMSAEGVAQRRATRHLSWLGQSRLGDAGHDRTGHVIAVLPDALQFRRTITLSRQAFARGRRSVALRLADYSPIPVDTSVFAFRRRSAPEADPVELEVAIARRRDLDVLRAALEDYPSWQLVGDVDEAGSASLVFEAHRPWQSGLAILRRGLLVYAALLICLFAWAGQAQRGAEAGAVRQAGLIAELRQVRTENDALVSLLAAGGQASLPGLVEIAAAAVETEASLATVQRIRFSAGGDLLIDGQEASDGGAPVNRSVRYPVEAEE